MARNRDTLPLVAATAVLALVLGFAYGATFNGGCESLKDAPFGCFEWWLSRYQTLIAMAGAILVAWLSVQPVLKQLKLATVQTNIALQQVHADYESRLDGWLRPELASLEKLSQDLTRGYYDREEDHAALPHWVWDMNQVVDRVCDRLIQQQSNNLASADLAMERQRVIEILERLCGCMSDYNGSVYADDPEEDLSGADRAKIDEAESRARKNLPGHINEVSEATQAFAKAVASEIQQLRKKRQFYEQFVVGHDVRTDFLN